VNEFVEECRSEWKRLGVPDLVADEMAAELAADLEEAEAEGASPEEVLGRGGFDPRSFAAAWAGERGVIQRPLPSGHRLQGRSRMPAAIATFALIPAIIGAVLLILASPSGSRRLTPLPPEELAVWVEPLPAVVLAEERARAQRTAAELAHARALLAQERALVLAGDTDGSGNDTRTVGSVLLLVGLAGIVPLTLFWLWAGPGGWSRRRTHIDDRPSWPA